MKPVRSRKPSRLFILCCALTVLGALGFASLAIAQEVGDLTIDRTVKKVPPAARETHAQTQNNQGLGVPSNDECAGAIVIPDGATNTGDYPVCSDVTLDVGSATPDCGAGAGSDPASCLPPPSYIANTVWYKWSPTVSAYYKILACHGDDCGPGTTVTTGTDPTRGGDGAIALFSGSSCGGFSLVGCDDDGCGSGNSSKINLVFVPAGEYYIMAGNWTNGSSCNTTNGTVVQYQIRIEFATPPANDKCDNAEVLQLNQPAPGGMNGLTVADYTVPTACYTTAGQIPSTQVPSTAPGRDLCYSFTAPADGNYSFYVKHYNAGPSTTTAGPNMVLYVADGPAPPAPGPISTCINAASRALPVNAVSTSANTANFGNSEETFCVPMTAGQTVFPIVDETAASLTSDTNFWIEATTCTFEIEFNGTPVAANDPNGDGTPNSALSACPVEGQIFSFSGNQDIDFWTLGVNATPDARLFAMVDCDGANPREDGASSTNLDLRVTDPVNTIEFDDQDLSTPDGTLCPNVAGTRLPVGTPLYLRVNNTSATTSTEPYRIHAIVRGPLADAVPEPRAEPNDNRLQFGPGSDYVHGTHDTSVDYDYFAFCAKKGDYIMVNVDTDPTKDATPAAEIINLTDNAGNGVPVPGFLGFGVGNASVIAPNPGPGLTATTPRFSGDGLVWRATYSGYYIASILGVSPLYVGDYLYQQSLNCAAPDADMGVTKTGPATASAGSDVTYTVVATNNGPNLALLAEWIDQTPTGTTFVSITIPDGWDCVTPDPGTEGLIDCFANDVCYEGSGTFEVTVHIPFCTGPFSLENTAYMFSSSTDSNSTNDQSTWTLLVTDDGSCDDGNFCTVNDRCQDGACTASDPRDCSDGNACTDDSCDEEANQCVSVNDDTNTCSDNNACTTVDSCSNGVCVGAVPPNCNDGNNNTTDTCDPSTGCVNTCNDNDYFHGYGFYKRLCRGPHPSGEFLSQVDVECVNNHCPFQTVQTVADICDRLNPDPQNDKCEQAEAQFMTLLLNYCRCGLGHHQPVAASCGPDTTVEQAINGAEEHLCPSTRTHQDCVVAHDCETEPINNGSALWANSLRVAKNGTTVTLTWAPPYSGPDSLTQTPHNYRIYARSVSEAPMVQIGQVSGGTTSFQQFNASGNQQYEVIAIW